MTEQSTIFCLTNIQQLDTEINDDDEKEYSERYQIQLFGITKTGQKIRVEINDFPPYFYVKVPDSWGKSQMNVFINTINPKIRAPYKNAIDPGQCTMVKRETMVGFTNHKKFNFVRLTFDNMKAMKQCSYIFNYSLSIPSLGIQRANFEIFESNIDPVLRFIHITNIQPCGWIQVEGDTTGPISFTKIKPVPDNSIPPFTAMAFDIECISRDGSFPKPERPDDRVIMVASTFRRYNEPNSFLKVIHTIKESTPIPGTKIITCESERDLLLKWRDLIQEIDPDFVYGYNSNGFDFTYMYERANLLKITGPFLRMSRIPNIPAEFVQKRLSSSALGDNLHKFIDMPGRIILDVMKEIQKEQIKLEMYKLDYVLKFFLKDAKVDLKPQELFNKFRSGSKDDIKEIGIYCLKDTDSCHDLIWKLNILIKSIKMANVCSVPLEYIFIRGQGIKIFSLISKECRKRKILVPLVKKKWTDNLSEEAKEAIKEQERYEGAVVIPPTPGLYYEPVVVNDYNSLYPNCQRGWNISHDTIVLNPQYDNLPGFTYETITYKDTQNKEERINNCRFVQVSQDNSNQGIIPEITGMLLKTRKEIKNKMKTVKDPMELMNLDCEQLAYKLVANSIYGQTGAPTSPIYLKHIAACTTAKGREMLYLAKDVAEEKFKNIKCIYGDSVPGYTPVLVKLGTDIMIKRIDQLADYWKPYDEFKNNDTNRREKLQAEVKLEVWTDNNWSKIRRVIKHKTKKKIYRILTHTGLVDVTEDHSLLTPNLEIISPEKCNIGTKLLHSFPNEFLTRDIKISPTEAQNIGNTSQIIRTQIPPEILMSPIDIRREFWNGYNTSHGYTPRDTYIKGQVEAMSMYYLLQSLGYAVSIDNTHQDIYVLTLNQEIKEKEIIKKIFELYETGENEFVYDLETESGRFQAGIGSIIVKNTDSNFYEVRAPPLSDKLTLEEIRIAKIKEAMRMGEEISKTVNDAIGKPGILNFAYEKVAFPLLLVTKKRYYYRKYEDSPHQFKDTVMGLATKRRNYCKYTKDTLQRIFDILMESTTPDHQQVFQYVKTRLADLIKNKVPLDELVITAGLREDYKNENVAHFQLAKRMRQRGETVNSNDRIAYIFSMIKPVYNTRGTPIKPLDADIVEEINYAKDNNIKYDPEKYITGQLQEPVCQILNFIMDDPKELFNMAIVKARKEKEKIYGPALPVPRASKK